MQNCAKGHKLNWTMDSAGYMAGVYACDRCHKSTQCTNGRWACKPCKYDVCPTCLAPPTAMCGKGHPLNWSLDSAGYMAGTFSCDLCKKSHKCSEGRWTCPCKYDVCSNCRAPPPPPVPMTAYIQCNKMHPLTWTTDSAGYMAGVFSCDICKKSQQAGNGRWSCAACKYDVCSTCRPAEEPVAPPVPMTAFIQCNSMHPLTWTASTAGYMMGKFSCDICKKSMPASFGRWSCPGCKYDVCHVCRSPVEKKCKSGHTLMFSADSAGYMGGKYACDNCHKTQECSTGRYTCSCKFDLCPNCQS